MTRRNKNKNKKDSIRFDWAPSFDGSDREFVRKLVERVQAKSKNANIFFDENHLPELLGEGSSKFREVYGEQTQFVSPVVSKEYVENDYAIHEFEAARKAEKHRGETTLLPVRLDDSELLGLTEDRIYLDVNEHSIELMAEVISKRIRDWKSTQKQTGGKQKSIEILGGQTRMAFGLVSFLRYPMSIGQYKELFPKIRWKATIAKLQKAGLVELKDGIVEPNSKQAKVILKDLEERKRFRDLCVERLEPLRYYMDMAPILAMIYVSEGNLKEAAKIFADVANGVDVGHWLSLYINSLDALANPKIARKIGSQVRLELMHALGKCLSQAGRFDEAKTWLAKTRCSAARMKNDEWIGQTCLTTGVVFAKTNQSTKAIEWYEKALKIGRKINDFLLIGRSLGNISESKRDESPFVARKLLEESIEAKRKAGDEFSAAVATFQLGNIEAVNGRPDLAIPIYESAISEFNQFSDADISLLLRNLAKAHFDCGRNSKALGFFRRSAKMGEEFGALENAKMALIGMAQAAFELARLDEVNAAFNRLLVLATTSKDTGISTQRNNAGPQQWPKQYYSFPAPENRQSIGVR